MVAAANADNQPQQYSRPQPSSYQEPASYGPAQYNFNWAVQDDYSGNDYGHQEERNGDSTSGSYYTLLPDGRRQKVWKGSFF